MDPEPPGDVGEALQKVSTYYSDVKDLGFYPKSIEKPEKVFSFAETVLLKPKTLHASTFHFYLEQVSENWEQFCLPEAWAGGLGTSRALPSGALLAWGPLSRP